MKETEIKRILRYHNKNQSLLLKSMRKQLMGEMTYDDFMKKHGGNTVAEVASARIIFEVSRTYADILTMKASGVIQEKDYERVDKFITLLTKHSASDMKINFFEKGGIRTVSFKEAKLTYIKNTPYEQIHIVFFGSETIKEQ